MADNLATHRQRPVRPLGRHSTAAWPCWRSMPSPFRSTATSRATPTSPAAWPNAWASRFRSNFNLPYFATSPRDFWNRWHISLSTWLRDYLYIPLGGSRGGTLLTYRNLMLTMVLGGLWHGAAWTFVVWGIYHGLLLVVHRLASPWLERIQPSDPVDRACWKGLRIVVTFHLVCLGWLIFRAESMEQAAGMLERDRQPSGHSGRVVPGSGRTLDHPALAGAARAIHRRRPERHRPHALVCPQRVLHGVLLRDRPGRPVRRPAVHLLPVLISLFHGDRALDISGVSASARSNSTFLIRLPADIPAGGCFSTCACA